MNTLLKIGLGLCLFLATATHTQAQVLRQIKVEALSGAEWGQWIVNRGPDALSFGLNEYDKSQVAFSLPAQVGVYFSPNNWSIGLEFKRNTLFVNQLSGGDANGNPDEFRLSEKETLNFNQIFLGLGYNLLSDPTYSLIPTVSYGTFRENSLYGGRNNFWVRQAVKLDLKGQLDFEKMYLLISPTVSGLRLKGNRRNPTATVHSIFTYGINVGVGVRM